MTQHIPGKICPIPSNCDTVRCQNAFYLTDGEGGSLSEVDKSCVNQPTIICKAHSSRVELEEEVELEEGATRKFPEKCPECGAGWMTKNVPWQHKDTCSKYPSGVAAHDPDDIDDGDIDDDDDIEDDDDFDDFEDDFDDEEWDIEEGDDELGDEED
jgi:hypothetical protein